MAKYVLVTTSEPDLDIDIIFYDSESEARTAMTKDAMAYGEYETLEDLLRASNYGFAGYSDYEVWTNNGNYNKQWKIAKIPK